MKPQFSRTQLLLGAEGVKALAASRVCVFGVGGVGGYVVEALARAGVGALDIVDADNVDVSNLNRQIIATWDTVGQPKVQVMAQRIASINPDCRVTAHQCFYLPEQRDAFDFSQYNYVVDAIDTVTAKIDLVLAAGEAGVPIISAMGAGNKLDPTRLEVADIYDTSMCKLAKVMRKELRVRGVKALKCVYSKEEPVKITAEAAAAVGLPTEGKLPPGSVSFVPSVAGLIIAGEVVKDLIAQGAR
ncbi:MAG: tRNA threonylcarbamoyladenosine dehydratase [Eggerthellales bacterium]|nr:tRNA threonylcarbamoyladenosine dehydratase [Eggerthellales bacterium]